MPDVVMPDGVVVTMPDNPTPEQLAQLSQIHSGALTDFRNETGRVADKVVRRGLSATPGILGDATLSAIRQIDKPGANLAVGGSLPLTAMRSMFQMFGGNPADDTKFGDVQHNLETAGGALPEVSQPQTSQGKAIANVLEPAVATVSGGGAGTFLQKAIMGLMSGAGGEAAARWFGDTPMSRLLGSAVGGGVTGAVQSQVPNTKKLVTEATEHMTDKDWADAAAREQVLNANEIPHTKSQLLGPRSTLDDVVAAASSNPSVRPKLVTIPETAAPKAQEAVNVFTNANLPPPGPGSRQEVLTDVQRAAADKLKSIRDNSNSAFTAAMPPKNLEYPPERVKAIYDSLKQLADDPKYGSTANAGIAINNLAERLVQSRPGTWVLPDAKNQRDLIRRFGKPMTSELEVNNILERGGKVFYQSEMDGSIDELKSVADLRGKSISDMIGIPPVPAGNEVKYVTNAHKINNINKELKLMATTDDYKGLPIQDVRRILNDATPEFNAARAAKGQVMENQYNPASRGLLGQIAQQGGGPNDTRQTARDAAMSIVFNPTMPQAPQIRQLAKDMGGDQVADLLREHISRTMQQVLRSDDKSPRSFVQALYESPAQKENVDAALEVAAKAQKMNPDAVKVGFRRLMESLDSFKDLKLSGGVSPNATAQQAGQNVVSKVAQPMSGIRRFFEQTTTKGTYNEIANLVTSPDGLQKLRAIAKEPDQAIVQQMVLGIVGSTDAGRPYTK